MDVVKNSVSYAPLRQPRQQAQCSSSAIRHADRGGLRQAQLRAWLPARSVTGAGAEVLAVRAHRGTTILTSLKLAMPFPEADVMAAFCFTLAKKSWARAGAKQLWAARRAWGGRAQTLE